MEMSCSRKDALMELVDDVHDGIPVSRTRLAELAEEMFTKENCDRIGVHWFDYAPDRVADDQNLILEPSVLAFLDEELSYEIPFRS